ncbi:MAG: 16S rRNA (cytidine(1402)-2'-O)-methyltransferase [Myxococcota bacterium]
MPGRLYVVATPIGNLGDLSPRALSTLQQVAVIACEDTRTSRVLLDHYGVSTPTTSLHAHSTEAELTRLLDRLEAGEEIALISDAGTPLVSDPGGGLVKQAIARGVQIVPLPGPSALLAALVGAGLDLSHFTFLGFLPTRAGDRRETLAKERDRAHPLVIYESPRRVHETLGALLEVLGDRQACVARELTKHFETFDRGSLSALLSRYAEGTLGEVVIIVDGASAAPAEDRTAAIKDEVLRLSSSGLKTAEAARRLAGAFGLTRQEAYQALLDHKPSE